MKALVYAELGRSLSFDMMEDKDLLIINDNAVFIITTQEHALNYPDEEFFPVCAEAIKDYGIREENGRIVSDYSFF